MSNLNERIDALIKALNIRKTVFAERLNVSQPFVTQLTKGASQPSDRTIADICREFNVNEIWLREGVGEMFQEKTVSEELAEFFGDVLNRKEDAEFKRAFLTILARMSPEEWRMVEAKARELMAEMEKSGPN